MGGFYGMWIISQQNKNNRKDTLKKNSLLVIKFLSLLCFYTWVWMFLLFTDSSLICYTSLGVPCSWNLPGGFHRYLKPNIMKTKLQCWTLTFSSSCIFSFGWWVHWPFSHVRHPCVSHSLCHSIICSSIQQIVFKDLSHIRHRLVLDMHLGTRHIWF